MKTQNKLRIVPDFDRKFLFRYKVVNRKNKTLFKGTVFACNEFIAIYYHHKELWNAVIRFCNSVQESMNWKKPKK
jgi:hypothetical protein